MMRCVIIGSEIDNEAQQIESQGDTLDAGSMSRNVLKSLDKNGAAEWNRTIDLTLTKGF